MRIHSISCVDHSYQAPSWGGELGEDLYRSTATRDLTTLHYNRRSTLASAWCWSLPRRSDVVDVISAGHVEQSRRRQSCTPLQYTDQRRAWPTGSSTNCNLPSSSVRSVVRPGMSRCQTTCSPTGACIQSRQPSCHCRSCFCQSRWSGRCYRLLDNWASKHSAPETWKLLALSALHLVVCGNRSTPSWVVDMCRCRRPSMCQNFIVFFPTRRSPESVSPLLTLHRRS